MITETFKTCGQRSEVRDLRERIGLLNDAINFVCRISGWYLASLIFLRDNRVEVLMDEDFVRNNAIDIAAGLDLLRIDLESELDSVEWKSENTGRA